MMLFMSIIMIMLIRVLIMCRCWCWRRGCAVVGMWLVLVVMMGGDVGTRIPMVWVLFIEMVAIRWVLGVEG